MTEVRAWTGGRWSGWTRAKEAGFRLHEQLDTVRVFARELPGHRDMLTVDWPRRTETVRWVARLARAHRWSRDQVQGWTEGEALPRAVRTQIGPVTAVIQAVLEWPVDAR
ncbi:hypothetical protein LY13_003938 [Prauserella aidingensis]|uniref:hypothetical protein n=1 Tax=Prauserella aidingensis TaxID=387890 RepID=UPI0020A5C74F|nr:hypothetical protein [Prauserella aidingensis]MCP2255164.1 hypothetical protein [Prauserella aidingensis]